MLDLVDLEKVIEVIEKQYEKYMSDARTYTDGYRLRKQKEELVDQITKIERVTKNADRGCI